MSIIIGIILFMSLILIHELGHFWAAKKSGVKVLEFGIGIPPKVLTLFKDKSGTEYTLNLIPLGGFVRLKGENPEDSMELTEKDSFLGQSLSKKFIILLAGIIMNIAFAWALFVIIFTIGIRPMHVIPSNAMNIKSQSYLIPTYEFLGEKGLLSGDIQAIPVSIKGVLPDLPASKAGLLSGDILLSVNNQDVDSTNITNTLTQNIGKNIDIKYQRGIEIKETQVTCPSDNCLLGIVYEQGGKQEIKLMKFSIPQAMVVASEEIYGQTILTYQILGNLVSNLVSMDKQKINQSVQKLSGPVGAVKVGGLILDQFGWLYYVSFGAMISLALGIFNILPIPALDGGRTLSILIQNIFKLRPQKYFTIENYINLFFFVLLMGFGVYIILLDLVRFWGINIPWIGV